MGDRSLDYIEITGPGVDALAQRTPEAMDSVREYIDKQRHMRATAPISPHISEAIGEVGKQFGSPMVIDLIDQLLVSLLTMRGIAANMHGVKKPPPVLFAPPQ